MVSEYDPTLAFRAGDTPALTVMLLFSSDVNMRVTWVLTPQPNIM